MTAPMFLMLLAAFSSISGLITEGIKKLISDKNTLFYNKTPIYVVLTPDYNDLSNEIKSPWIEINYSSIYNILKDKVLESPYSGDFLFCDFVTSLESHSDKDFNRKIMQKMFLKEINNNNK